MARVKTKSDAVSFRLPIDLWGVFTGQAERDGLTASEYAAQVVRRHVQQRDAQR